MSTTRSTSTLTDSTPSPEMWNNILKGNVEKDDPFWKEYLDKAAVFDVRMVDECNKIVDVLLVYVALFISILTSFIANTTKFKRNPTDITNDLLVVIYNQMVAQSNNISIPPVDPTSYFNQSQADYDAAFTQNILLYISLSLSIIVSVIALSAKLWLVGYSRQAFSVGSPYDRAMRRQEAYNGVLVWNMEGVINMLPVILLVALYLFGFYVYRSVWAVQENIGQVIGALLSLGVFFLDFTSLGAAFISGCPFRSPSSAFIRHIFEKLQTLSKRIQCGFLSSKRLRRPWVGTLTFLWVALVAGIAYASLILPIWFPLLFLLACIPITYSTQHEHEAVHKPQKYKISLLAISVFLSISVSMILTICLDSFENPIFIALYVIETLAVISACWMFRKLSKSMADTGEIDAVAWLLTTTPPQYPATFFKKAGQMTGIDSIGRHYRPRLLESLMPLLTLLITSYHAPEHHSSGTHSPQSDDSLNGLVDDDMVPIDEDPHLKNLEIYIACLARLTDFTDCKGTFWCLREDAKQHPKLDQPLIDKLVELVDPQCHFQDGLRSAATKVLNNYKLNTEGNPLEESPTSTASTTTFLESVATDPRSEATMPNDNRLDSRERGHSELYRRVERATHVGPTTRGEPASHLGPAMRVEPASAASSMLNNSGLNSQEQGLAKMYRPVDPATCVEPEESEIGDEEIEEVMRDSA